MTPTILETMKQALAGFAVSFAESDFGRMKREQAIDCLRAAIKAMEDAEPVAWWNGKHIDARFSTKKDAPGIGVCGIPLYPAPAVSEDVAKDAERMVGWIDGVIEILELYRPETPSQKKWQIEMVKEGYALIQSHVNQAMNT